MPERTAVGTNPSPRGSAAAQQPEGEKRRLSRTSDDEAMLEAESGTHPITEERPERLEELPTEPRHALPTYPDTDWDAPTVPDGRTLDAWDMDERG